MAITLREVEVQAKWNQGAAKRGYNFGFNLKTLLADEKSLLTWFSNANVEDVGNRSIPNLTVTAFVPPSYAYLTRELLFKGTLGIQEIHWDKPGSHTGATHAKPVLTDFPGIQAVLINHSEVIAEHGRTLEQAALQLRTALDTQIDENPPRRFNFITVCVGEDRHIFDLGTAASVDFVKNQIITILQKAKVRPDEMKRIGFAYEPRFAIQVGDIPGIPPSDEHIRTMGWSILGAVASVVELDGIINMPFLQYGGSMKGPNDKIAPVQRFVGQDNLISDNLYNGGLIGTAGKDPKTAAEILYQIVRR
jgi:triosephosphate isomerase